MLDNNHVSFEEMSDYVFSNIDKDDFISIASKINKHVMECASCKECYERLMQLKDAIVKIQSHETVDERLKTRLFALLYTMEKPTKNLINECFGFQKWLTFSIKNYREISQSQSKDFSHPVLATVMNSVTPGQESEVTETEIMSSLCDRNRNRVSIGLDGTLSLYFDATDHSAGKRVVILPDDTEKESQMLELTRYDESISYVRFEGISPGQYTVVVEE